jgi:hydroxymethylbilane synthase
MRKLVIGTRGSALALEQTRIVTEALRRIETDLDIEVRTVRTEGDRRLDVSLEAFGGQGVFVKDIEGDLLNGAIDLAVHSLKDMPAETPAGLTIGAVLPRGDVRDALVSFNKTRLAALPSGARVGTDSRRRSLQLLALRPDLRVESIRGNVDTRVRKAESGEIDAVVLAAAGLERLGLFDQAAQVFEVDEMLPAVGQGILAIEARADDQELLALLRRVEDKSTRVAAEAERAFLRRLGAGCRLPVGAYAVIRDGSVRLQGLLGDDAGVVHRGELSVPAEDAIEAGYELADRLTAISALREPQGDPSRASG